MLGDIAEGVAIAEKGIDYANRNAVAFNRMSSRASLANALHQAGEPERAQVLLREAETIQANRQPVYPRLYSAPAITIAICC